jgi:hypothetical protein
MYHLTSQRLSRAIALFSTNHVDHGFLVEHFFDLSFAFPISCRCGGSAHVMIIIMRHLAGSGGLHATDIGESNHCILLSTPVSEHSKLAISTTQIRPLCLDIKPTPLPSPLVNPPSKPSRLPSPSLVVGIATSNQRTPRRLSPNEHLHGLNPNPGRGKGRADVVIRLTLPGKIADCETTTWGLFIASIHDQPPAPTTQTHNPVHLNISTLNKKQYSQTARWGHDKQQLGQTVPPQRTRITAAVCSWSSRSWGRGCALYFRPLPRLVSCRIEKGGDLLAHAGAREVRLRAAVPTAYTLPPARRPCRVPPQRTPIWGPNILPR